MAENRVYMHDDETHLDVHEPLAVGDVIQVFRGNGPREGDRMGTATVTAIEDGVPVLNIRFGTESGSDDG
jgi:hypothetical protein